MVCVLCLSFVAQVCPYEADVLFLMDASSSIGPENFARMTDFLKGIVQNFDIGHDLVRVGLITFNFGARFEFFLNSYSTKSEILAAFDSLGSTQVGTATHRALKIAREQGFTAEHGDRPGVPNIAILVTDGRSTKPEETAIQQALLKDTGARIFSIGIGWTDEEELRLIASDPVERYFHYVKDFSGLEDILNEFQETACNGMRVKHVLHTGSFILLYHGMLASTFRLRKCWFRPFIV